LQKDRLRKKRENKKPRTPSQTGKTKQMTKNHHQQQIPNNLKGDGEIKPENISNQEKNSSG